MNKVSVHSCEDEGYEITKIKKDVPDDLFIACISYEPRTIGILKKLDDNYKANVSVFVTNKKVESFTKLQKYKDQVKNILESKSYFRKTEDVSLFIDNPIQIIIEIDKIIKNILPGRQNINITLDITTFPRNELLVLIYYLRHLIKVKTLRILYISPTEYGDWLTDGYRYSMVPPFFEGEQPASEKKTALFILTGFEYGRAVSLIDDIEPSILLLGRPRPGTSKDFGETSEKIINKIKRTRRVKSEVYDVPANNPLLCRDRIEEIFQQNSNYNIYVAPMGTKLEVLGVYLDYEKNTNFRVICPLPLIYNVGDYSRGCRDIYEISLKRNRGGDNGETE